MAQRCGRVGRIDWLSNQIVYLAAELTDPRAVGAELVTRPRRDRAVLQRD